MVAIVTLTNKYLSDGYLSQTYQRHPLFATKIPISPLHCHRNAPGGPPKCKTPLSGFPTFRSVGLLRALARVGRGAHLASSYRRWPSVAAGLTPGERREGSGAGKDRVAAL